MNKKITPYLENISEAGCACLITMVQGNIFAITLSHWVIALETGLIAGAIASTAILSGRFRQPSLIAITLGLITAITDYFIHPGNLGMTAMTEAAVTGAGAAVLSYIVSLMMIFVRYKKISDSGN